MKDSFKVILLIMIFLGFAASHFTDINGGVIYVTDYGALGDGLTDDTAAIQEAIDAAVDANVDIVFPAGTYLVSSTLTVDNTNIKVSGFGQVKFEWAGGNNDVMFHLIDWERCEFSNFIFENTNNAFGVTCILLTSNADTVTLCHFHDLEIGQPSYGFEKGIEIGTGGMEYFTNLLFELIQLRHCTYGVYQNSTTFDLIVFRNISANGGGSGPYNSTNHFYLTRGGHITIDTFESNRANEYSINAGACSIRVQNAWFESSGGAIRHAGGGSPDINLITRCKFTSGVLDENGYCMALNPTLGSPICIESCRFDTGHLFVYSNQTLYLKNNYWKNGAGIRRTNQSIDWALRREPYGMQSPTWKAFQITHSSFTSKARSETIDLVPDLEGATVIHDAFIDKTKNFTGGGSSFVTLDVGDNGNDGGYIDGAEIHRGNIYINCEDGDQGPYLHNGSSRTKHFLTERTTIQAKITSDVNVNQLTTGNIYIYLLISTPVSAVLNDNGITDSN